MTINQHRLLTGYVSVLAAAALTLCLALVLLGYGDLHWDDVEAELRRRSGVSGIAEKASRGPADG